MIIFYLQYILNEIFKKKILFNVCKFIHPSNECCHTAFEKFYFWFRRQHHHMIARIVWRILEEKVFQKKKKKKTSYEIEISLTLYKKNLIPIRWSIIRYRKKRHNFLNIHHPDRWWEGDRKSRSLDLIPLFFWDYMKSKCVKQW